MTNQIEKLKAAFVDFQTSTQSRPDGGLLFTMRGKNGKSMARVISPLQLRSSLEIDWFIGSIRRDLAMLPEELPALSALQSQQRFDMPTYLQR